MLTLTLQVSSARLSARIFPSPPHNLASSSSASSGPSSPRTEERHAALQPVAEACAEVIPRADKARHQNGYPCRILLDALCAVLDSFCATRESAIALKQVRTITVIRDSFDAHYGVRLTSVAAAQRVLDSLKSEDGSMPLDMQFRYGGVFADDRFTFFEEAAMEQIPKNKRANIWTQMDMCLSLLTGQARPSSKKEAVSSYWAKKYTLASKYPIEPLTCKSLLTTSFLQIAASCTVCRHSGVIWWRHTSVSRNGPLCSFSATTTTFCCILPTVHSRPAQAGSAYTHPRSTFRLMPACPLDGLESSMQNGFWEMVLLVPPSASNSPTPIGRSSPTSRTPYPLAEALGWTQR